MLFFGCLPAAAHPKNVLLITVDTLRADHISCYGYSRRTTPHIDELASQGIRFSRAYTVIPLTGPAHLSLFTSRYPQEHGAVRNGTAPSDERKYPALPQLLRRRGYQTAAFISAWPLTARLTHLDRWFDHYDENLNRRYQLFNSSRYAEDVTPPAIDWLKKHSGASKPFFLWVHYFDPHSPYDLRSAYANWPEGSAANPKEDSDRSERVRAYDSEIAYTDHHIGLLLKTLDDLGLRGSTLVALLADHGESLGEHDYVGHGRHLFENIIRIPMIWRVPEAMSGAKVINTPVSILDVTPTIMDLIAQTKSGSRRRTRFAGRSLAAALTGNTQLPVLPIRYVTFAGKKGFAPNWLSWLWVHEEDLPSRFGRIKGNAKLVWSTEDSQLASYDVAADPLEIHPRMLKPASSAYRIETAGLKNWFEATGGPAGSQTASARDAEVLKSLGYVQ